MRIGLAGLSVLSSLAHIETANAQSFTFGMSISDARSAIADAGYTVAQVPNSQDLVFSQRQSNGLYEFMGSVSFCGQRLYGISRNVAGGFPAFSRVAKSYSDLYGPGTSSVKSDQTDYGLWSNIELKWKRPDGVEVSVSHGIMTGAINASPNPSVSRGEDARALVCR